MALFSYKNLMTNSHFLDIDSVYQHNHMSEEVIRNINLEHMNLIFSPLCNKYEIKVDKEI